MRGPSRSGGDVAQVTTQQGAVLVRLTGPLPAPDTAADKQSLRSLLVAKGVNPRQVKIELLPQATIQY